MYFYVESINREHVVFMYVCMYVCISVVYVYFNKWRSDRVLVRLGLDTLIGWLHVVYVCMCM